MKRLSYLNHSNMALVYYIGAFFIGLLALVTVALAQQPNAGTKENQCNTIANVVEQLKALPAELRNQLHIRVLNDEQTTRWAAAFNAIPPASNMRFDGVAFIRRDGNQFIVLLAEVNGCVQQAVKLQPEMHFRLLRDSGLERGKVI